MQSYWPTCDRRNTAPSIAPAKSSAGPNRPNDTAGLQLRSSTSSFAYDGAKDTTGDIEKGHSEVHQMRGGRSSALCGLVFAA